MPISTQVYKWVNLVLGVGLTLYSRGSTFLIVLTVLTQISLMAWGIILFSSAVISDSTQVFASSFGGPIRPSITKQQETSSPAGHAMYQGSFTSSKWLDFTREARLERGWYPQGPYMELILATLTRKLGRNFYMRKIVLNSWLSLCWVWKLVIHKTGYFNQWERPCLLLIQSGENPTLCSGDFRALSASCMFPSFAIASCMLSLFVLNGLSYHSLCNYFDFRFSERHSMSDLWILPLEFSSSW